MPTRFEILVNDDKTSTSVKMVDESGSSATATLNAENLLGLIKALGSAHAQMIAGNGIPQLAGVKVEAIFDTRWYVNPELMGEASALSFYHPSFGPLGFLVPIDQVEYMASLLTKQVELAKQSRQAKAN